MRDADGRQHGRGRQRGFDFLPLRAQAALGQDDDQRGVADHLGQLGVVELDVEDAVLPHGDADAEVHEQAGQPAAGRNAYRRDGDQQDERADQQKFVERVDSQGPFLPCVSLPDRPPAASTSLPYLIFNVFLTPSSVRANAGAQMDRIPIPRPSGFGGAPMVAPALPGPPCPSKDSDARQHNRPSGLPMRRRRQEGATRPPDRDRPGAGARRGCRLRRVLVRLHGPGLLPADHRFARAQGPVRRPCDVKRDDYGIPQIYADTDSDLFRAQGFVQAQDRFWEMDVRRHMTSGRLSEMFGAGQVETDAFLRTLGWRQVAQQEYDSRSRPRTPRSTSRRTRTGSTRIWTARTARTISVEYAALGLTNDYKPAEWTPVDSVAWLKAMAWDLRGNMQDEIDRALMTSRLSAKQIEELYPAYPYEQNKPIVEQARSPRSPGSTTPRPSRRTPSARGPPRAPTEGLSTQLSALSETLDEIPALLGPNGNGIGSNSWVVSGEYTTTGKPLLANDPHLAPQLPSLWYQMGLHCRQLSSAVPVRRGRLHLLRHARRDHRPQPGHRLGLHQPRRRRHRPLPGEGHGRRLPVRRQGRALHHPRGDHQGRGRQEPDDHRARAPTTVRWSPTAATSWTKVGKKAPVTNSAPDRGDGYAVALKWTALDPGKTMDAVFELDRAKDFTSFRRRPRDFEVPVAEPHLRGHQGQHRLPGARQDPGPRQGRRHATPGPAGTRRLRLGARTRPASTSCRGSTTRRAATSSPPTRPSSTTTTRTCSPRTGATAPAASGSTT